MKFKNLILLAALAFILLAGCAQPPQPDKGKDVQQSQTSESTVEDDEQPPAPPSDDEGTESQSAADKSDMPPLPPSEDEEVDVQTTVSNESDMPSLPPSEEDEIPSLDTQSTKSNLPEFVGLWRAFSSRMFYDAGGGGAVGSGTGHPLEINEDGTWQFSTSAGNWSVADIAPSDWEKWGVSDYGPTRKIILDNWNNATADGPVEESDGRVDFLWVIYRVESPTVSSPGQIQAKYGHAS